MKPSSLRLSPTLATVALGALLASPELFGASPPSWGWAQAVASSGGGAHGEQGRALAFDPSGGIYLAGWFAGSALFGSERLESLGGTDAFLAKFNAQGSLVWLRSFGGSSDEWILDMKRDAAGNLYLCGGFYGTAQFGAETLVSRGGRDAFLVKCDASGNVLWARSAGASGDYDWALSLCLAGGGSVCVVGQSNGPIDFGGSGLPGLGSYDGFVALFDADGTLVWAQTLGGASSDVATRVAALPDGDLVVTGEFRGVGWLGSRKLVSAGGSDIFVARLSADTGEVVWAERFGGIEDDSGTALAIDPQGRIYLGGSYAQSLQVANTTLVARGGSDALIILMNEHAEVLAVLDGGGVGHDGITSLAAAGSWGVYAAGYFHDAAVFDDQSVGNPGSYGLFVGHYLPSGALNWIKSVPVENGTWGQTVQAAVAPDGALVLTGSFLGTASFDGLEFAAEGGWDIFLATLRVPGSRRWEFAAEGQIRSTAAIGADGTLYFGCQDARLYALDPHGQLRWAFPTRGGEILTAPALANDGTVYFGTTRLFTTGTPSFYAVNPDGSQRWEIQGTGDVSGYGAVAIGSDGTAYFASFDQKVYAVYPNGASRWTTNLGDRVTGVTVGTDHAGSEVVYATTHGGRLIALDAQGAPQWEYPTAGFAGGLSIGADGTLHFTSGDRKLHAVGPNGFLRWNFPAALWTISETTVGADGALYFTAADGELYALNAAGSPRWQVTLGGNIHTSPALAADGTIYATAEYQRVFALNADGAIQWSFDTGFYLQASPVIGPDGTVYIGGMDGRFYALQGSVGPAESPWPQFGGNQAQTRRRAPVSTPLVRNKLLLRSGAINGQTVNASERTVLVDPGQALTGSFTVLAHNAMGANAIAPVGAMPTWGDARNSYWEVISSVGTGDTVQTVTLPQGLAAPHEAGVYHLVVGMAGRYNAAQVMSGTHADPSGTADWQRGFNLAAIPEHDLSTAAHQGWLPYVWWSPADQVYTTEDLAITVVDIVVASPPPVDRNTILLQSGTINGQTLSPASRTATVPAGSTLAGSFVLAVHNAMGANAIAPLGATPTWGVPSESYWTVNGWVPPGDSLQTVSLPAGLRAPSTAGTYHLVVGMAGRYNAAQVMSGTHADPSGVADWANGHHLADIPAEQLEAADDTGWLPYSWWWPSTGSYANEDLAITRVTLKVETGAGENPNPPSRNTILLLTGTVNGQTVSADRPNVTAQPGQALSGSFSVLVHNAMGANAIAPVGATPTWGTPEESLWEVASWVAVGDSTQTVTLPDGLRAPDQPGVYHIVVGMAGRYTAAQVMSGTHADPSGTVDWTRGFNLARIPAGDLDTAARQGWLPYVWWWPWDQFYAAEDLAVTMVRIVVAETPLLDRSTLVLQAGNLNGQAINAVNRTITVEAGQAITGNFKVLVHNTLSRNAVAPVGATPTWGQPAQSYWTVTRWAPAGNSTLTVTLPDGFTAPSDPGTYYLLVAMAGRYNAAQVISGTHADPSGTVDWLRGRNVAKLAAADLELAAAQGWLPYLWFWPSLKTYATEAIAITTVRIVVSEPSAPHRSTITLLTGTINDQSITANRRTVTVPAGEAIHGSFEVRIHNAMDPTAIAPVAATPTWGQPHESYWCVADWIGSGDSERTVVLPTGLRAPDQPGVYHIVVGMSGRFNCAQVASGTHADPIGIADWVQGPNLALLPADTLDLAASQGWVAHHWWWPSTQTYAAEDLALTSVRVHVPVLLRVETSVTAGGGVLLSTQCREGSTFLLQRSVDLKMWQDLGSATSAGGPVLINDTTVGSAAGRYYRVVLAEAR